MKRSSLAKGLTWAGAIAGTSVMAITLTGGAAFAGGGPSAAGTWNGKLKANTAVTVTGKKWVAGDTLAVAECNPNVLSGDANACDEDNAVLVTATSKGKIPAATVLTFATGTIGDGTCNKKQTCYIEVIDYTQYLGGGTPDSAAFPVVVGKAD